MPAYRSTKKYPSEPTGVEIRVCIGGREVRGTYRKCMIPEIGVPVYLVEHNSYFDRDGLYNNNNRDYDDNCERFVFFSYAVMEAVRLLNLKVDILHLNDWQTGLIPALQSIFYRDYPGYEKIAHCTQIITLRTRAFFPAQSMALTVCIGVLQLAPDGVLRPPQSPKTGILFADGITTVVRITRTKSRCRRRLRTGRCAAQSRDRSFGITNGIDTDEWILKRTDFCRSYNSERAAREKSVQSCASKQDGLPSFRMFRLSDLWASDGTKGFDLAWS